MMKCTCFVFSDKSLFVTGVAQLQATGVRVRLALSAFHRINQWMTGLHRVPLAYYDLGNIESPLPIGKSAAVFDYFIGNLEHKKAARVICAGHWEIFCRNVPPFRRSANAFR
jgi:hypothetical protein